MDEIITMLNQTLSVLEDLSTSGRRNRIIVTAVENTIDDVIQRLNAMNKEPEGDGGEN